MQNVWKINWTKIDMETKRLRKLEISTEVVRDLIFSSIEFKNEYQGDFKDSKRASSLIVILRYLGLKARINSPDSGIHVAFRNVNR